MRKFLIVWFWFKALHLFAQPSDAAFRNLTPADGLPTTTVTDISQDSFGLIWIGSWEGVYRFDGTTYKLIYSGDARFLSADDHGGMWLSIEGGKVAYYNSYNDSLGYYNIPNCIRFTRIKTDKNGGVWAATGNGVSRFNPESGKFFIEKGQKTGEIAYLRNLGGRSLYFLLLLGNGKPNLVGCRDSKGEYHYEPFPIDSNNPEKGKLFNQAGHIDLLKIDSTGILLVNKFGWAYKKPITSDWVFRRRESRENIPEHSVGIIDNSDCIWLKIEDGIIRIDIKTGKTLTYTHNPERYSSILSSKNALWNTWPYPRIFVDRQGILWIAIFSSGISRLNLFESDFGLLKDEEEHTIRDVLSALELKDGSFWVGARSIKNGLIHFSSERSVIKRYYGSNSINTPPGRTTGTELSQAFCWALALSEDGSIWAGTGSPGPHFGGVNRIRPNSDLITRFKYDPDNEFSLSFDWVDAILVDSSNRVWISGFRDSLCSIDPKTEIVTRGIKSIYSDTTDNTTYVPQLITSTGDLILSDSHRNEHYIINHKTLEVKKFGPKIFPDARWYYKHQDKAGRLWFVSSGKFGYLDPTFSKIEHIYDLSKTYFHINEIPALISDNYGKIWMATNDGIFQFDPVTEKFRHYSYERGIQGNRFSPSVNYKGPSGKIYFGGNGGVNIFDPAEIKSNPYPPDMVFTDVKLDDKPVLIGNSSAIDKPIIAADRITVEPGISSISFSFAAIHFAGQKENQYKYKLDGFDKDWREGGNTGNATYTNLSPGKYTLFIKGSNWDGVWSDGKKSIEILVEPPFWATWWAYTFYILFGLGLLYSLRQYELNRSYLKNQVKLDEVKLREREETDRMKSRFFANISHEFRTPLTLILGPAESIRKDSSEEEIEKQTGIIKRNANRLLGLINQLLDLSKLEAGRLELKTTKANIVPFIKGITMSFESIAERKDITLEVTSLNNIIEMYFDREKMTKIMINLLSNAFKFTPDDGQITVSISEDGKNSIAIKVRDTGIGISEEELPKLFDRFYQVDSSQTRIHEGTGIGLALTKELTELHHGTISVESKPGSWTEFTVRLPIGRDHLKDEEMAGDEISTQEGILNGMKSLNAFDSIESSIGMDGKTSSPDRPGITENERGPDEDKNIVLVVEDNTDVREFIRDSLGEDFQIEEASNGEQGVRKAEQIIPDLIISDIMMPKMDGNELTTRIKNNEKTSHIPVILLTARSEQKSRLEGLETGADDYLTKPFDAKELKIRIRNLIAIRRRLQEIFAGGQILQRKGEKKLSVLDENFLQKVLETVEKHLAEEEFSIEKFSEEVGMNRVQLHRKLKAITGKSPSIYLRSVRLSKAKKMIEDQQGNISEIAYSVGFSSPTYFSRCFKEEFGHTPSDLLK